MKRLNKLPANANFSTPETRKAYVKAVNKDARQKNLYGEKGVYDDKGNRFDTLAERDAHYGLCSSTTMARAKRGHTFHAQVGRTNSTPLSVKLGPHTCFGDTSDFHSKHPNTGYTVDKTGHPCYKVTGISNSYTTLKALWDEFGVRKEWADILLAKGYTVDDIILPLVCKHTPKELDFMRQTRTIPGGTPGRNSLNTLRISTGAYVSSMPDIKKELIVIGKKPANKDIFNMMIKENLSCEAACIKYSLRNAEKSGFKYSPYKQAKYGYKIVNGKECWENPVVKKYGELAYKTFNQFAKAFGMEPRTFARAIDTSKSLRTCLLAELNANNIPKQRYDLIQEKANKRK